MKKTIKIIIILLIILLVGIISILFYKNEESELKTIKSYRELEKIYNDGDSDIKDIALNILTMPFSMYNWIDYGYKNTVNSAMDIAEGISSSADMSTSLKNDTVFSKSEESSFSTKDYSTTNIQVENVDEADITKTDGDYIYSISEDKVIITNVKNPSKIEIEATIKPIDNSIPEDLIIYKDKLVVISTTSSNYNQNNYYNYGTTIVKIYDITQRKVPMLVKSYELYDPYYTSRCINNQLYVIASGGLREDDEKIITYYEEDNFRKEIGLDNIKYLKDVEREEQTLISVVDLDEVKKDIKVTSYLIDISNAYVSENSIYLLNQKYLYDSNEPPISSLFGLKGAIGPFVYSLKNDDYGYYTEIYKFDISKDGNVKYKTKTRIKGKTINQYSLDEYEGHFRVALFDNDGTRVAIFNERLEQIGISEYVAKGEKMYSSRFIKDKVYLVTYKTIDPLFVIDLSDEQQPKVLGKLKIPGYSTYLHPYDENHLIGIGMETEEVINRDSSGKVLSTTARIIGMKMALFDVSDVNNPIQISNTVIGDKRTTSAILTNPKALLFSKEKGLIAIPVNNYSEDFEINNSNDSYSSIINSYTKYNKSYISEGYLVYNIDVQDGFNLKGVITHEKNLNKNSSYYYNKSKLLRGLYIDNNLYTVSETAVKVNDLENLELISELKIK